MFTLEEWEAAIRVYARLHGISVELAREIYGFAANGADERSLEGVLRTPPAEYRYQPPSAPEQHRWQDD